MCEANAFVFRNGEETLLAEGIELVEPKEEGGSDWSTASASRRSSRENSRK